MNKLDILKSLAPGFLPLIIFIAADSIWGTKIGLIVAIAGGLIEIALSYIKEKIVDRFVLLDIGLITALGGVSILLDNPIFFKLKPALIEAIFCVILAVSIFSPVNLMLQMSKRYMKTVEFNEAQIRQLNRSLKILFYIFIIHTVLIGYSAFFMSKGAWAFISGGLFYIIFAVYFIVEFAGNKIRRKKMLEKYKDEEWFDILDSAGNVTGKAPRSLCHTAPGLLHAVVRLHIADDKNRLFLQKRSMKKEIEPGKWDSAAAGHVASGENPAAALERETIEELGLKEIKVTLVARYTWETKRESELVYMFFGRYNKAIAIAAKDEIDDGKFWKIKKIKENLNKGIFTPNFEYEFDILVKSMLK